MIIACIDYWVKENPTLATIIISLTVFFLGILFQFFYHKYQKNTERKSIRESYLLKMKEIIYKTGNKAKALQEFYPSITFERNSSTVFKNIVIPFINGIIKNDSHIYVTSFSAGISKKGKNDLLIAFFDSWSAFETLSVVETEIRNNFEIFKKQRSILESDFFNIKNDIIVEWNSIMQKETLHKPEKIDLLKKEYIENVTRIFKDFSNLNDADAYRVDLSYSVLLLPLMQANNEALQIVEQKFFKMLLNAISIYRQLDSLYKTNYKTFENYCKLYEECSNTLTMCYEVIVGKRMN